MTEEPLALNQESPMIMHIDLNSAFASIEQQARPTLRGRPIGITNRVSKNCCVIAASYEAKQLGIKVGMGLMEARQIVPNLIMLESDPPKYHFVYQKLARIMKSFSPDVVMKSIDEGVLDFHSTRRHINRRPIQQIGLDIKQLLRSEVGSWMKVSIGIGTNRFLAKTAANMKKPDGLYTIDHNNLLDVYRSLELTDLTGIAKHYKSRLNLAGIYTPLEFLSADPAKLRRIFHSVVGYDWHQRLRGWEVDDRPTKLGQVGRQFVMDQRTSDDSVILPRFHYLCETVGKKLRFNNMDARGILVWLVLQDSGYWKQRRAFKTSFYTDKEIYTRALRLFKQRPKMAVTTIGITCYKLTPSNRNQLSLLKENNREEQLTEAVDRVNERFDLFALHSLNSLEGKKIVRQKIPAFGGNRYFKLLLKRA